MSNIHKKQFSAADREACFAVLENLVGVKQAYDTAKKKLADTVKTYRLRRDAETMCYFHDAMILLFGTDAGISINSKLTALQFAHNNDAKNFWYREINFALPKLGRGKTKAKPQPQPVDKAVKDFAAKIKEFLKDYTLNRTEKAFLRKAMQ